MATTRYIVPGTTTYPEPKTMSNIRSARREADLRAKADRVSVVVTTNTGKTSYTAEPELPPIDAGAFYAVLAEVLTTDEPLAADAAPDAATGADADAPGDEGTAGDGDEEDGDNEEDGDDEEDGDNEEDGDGFADEAAAPTPAPGVDAPVVIGGVTIVAAAAAPRVRTPRKQGTGRKPAVAGVRGGRRADLGPSLVDGWGLLYDKPKQNTQVARRTVDGKDAFAVVCTVHPERVSTLAKLKDERVARRDGWCPDCHGSH